MNYRQTKKMFRSCEDGFFGTFHIFEKGYDEIAKTFYGINPKILNRLKKEMLNGFLPKINYKYFKRIPKSLLKKEFFGYCINSKIKELENIRKEKDTIYTSDIVEFVKNHTYSFETMYNYDKYKNSLTPGEKARESAHCLIKNRFSYEEN